MTRKLISLVLALCMIMSCFAISGISASAAVSDEATAAAGEITVYFTDNNNWGTVNVYAWGGSATGKWPGKAMTKYQDDNGYGQKVYMATVAADATGVVFNNGNGQQTVDIKTGIVDGAQWYLTGEQEGGKLKVGYIAPATPATTVEPGTTAEPTTADPNATTAAPGETITVFFTDAQNYGDVNVYYWPNGGNWPGKAMTKTEVNDYNQQIYTAEIPADVEGIIFNGNGRQTADIKEGIADNAWWYTVEQTDDQGHNNVQLVGEPETQEPTGEPETVEATTEPAPAQGGYYIVGTMTGWAVDADYQLTANEAAEGEYMYKGLNLTADSDEFKVVYSEDGMEATTWYPEGMGNNYGENGEITETNVYDVYFRPDGQGGEDWYYNCIYVAAQGEPEQPTTAEPTTADPNATTAEPTTADPNATTVAPAETIKVYFTDALGWGAANVHYWGGKTATEWPGNAMTVYQDDNGYGQKVYTATVPADVTGIIFNGDGNQTVDITTGIENGAQWYTNGEMEGNNYKVTKVDDLITDTTADPNATTAEPTTAEPTTVDPNATTAAPAETIKVYFTDALGWGAANVHYWGGKTATEWPGNAMTVYQDDNGYGQKVYTATIPGDATGIIFNGNGNQTVDITTGIENGAQWYTIDEKENNNYKVNKVDDLITDTTADPNATTAEPTTVDPNATTVAPAETIKVYFTDALGWGAANVHYWGGASGETTWPGNAMTVYKEDNGYGQKVYTATIPGDVTGIIFNGNNKQTVDITTGIENGAQWYTNGEMEGNNYKVTKVDDLITDTTADPNATTAEPTTVDPNATTVAPAETIKVYFTDALNWGEAKVYYWGTANVPAWPGNAMTVYQDDNGFGQKVYTATVPADVTGIIFNGGNKQTVDITTGIENGAQWYTIDEMEGNSYKVNKVDDLIIETTVAPSTAEPTTVEPTTVEPTTTPEPQPGDTTIKLVVPNNINSSYAWNDARLYYNFTGKTADNQYINMTATDETYYMTELGTGISAIANAGAWKVFTVTITEAQAAEIDNAIWVGFANGNNRNKTVSEKAKNVLKAGIETFDPNYSSAKYSISAMKDYTFIVKDNNSTTSPYTSFIGYWTSDFTTVMMAAPMSDNSYSNWNAVSLSYGESGDSETAIPMFNTGNTTKVSDIGDMSTLRTGRWYIYAVTLDATQTADVNAAKRVGFVKPGGNNRTAGSKNVLKAKTNVFDGTYNSTARTLEELEGQLFVVKAKATATSIVIYNGEWQTEDVYTAGNNDTVTIYFAAPKGADKTTAGWDTGVQLYYGTTTAYQNCEKVDMTPVNTTFNVSVADTGLTTLKSGDWDVYAIELDAQMISTVDAATTVGFIKTGSYNRTSALYTKNIAKAPTTEDGTYTKNKQSIETFDGKLFLIDSCADANNERTSYMGTWVGFVDPVPVVELR